VAYFKVLFLAIIGGTTAILFRKQCCVTSRSMRTALLWVITQRTVIISYRRASTTYWSQLQGSRIQKLRWVLHRFYAVKCNLLQPSCFLFLKLELLFHHTILAHIFQSKASNHKRLHACYAVIFILCSVVILNDKASCRLSLPVSSFTSSTHAHSTAK
jgi:hypothetical protein